MQKTGTVESFILGTVDMVTDWINYIQWSTVGGYDQYYFVFILKTPFLSASLVGTVLWIFEVFLTVKRSRESIQRYQKRPKVLKLENEHSEHDSEHSSMSDRLGLTVRILIGLLEDLPVVIALYYAAAIIPFCGVPAKRERSSPATIATVVSAMLNSLWTMFVLCWNLFGYRKIIYIISYCCTIFRRAIYPQAVSPNGRVCWSQRTLKKHQMTLTFATVSKVSDIENEWRSMRNKLFKVFLLIQQRFVGNIYIEKFN